MISRLLLLRWSAAAALATGASVGAFLWNARPVDEAIDETASCCTTAAPADEPTDLGRQKPMTIPDTPVIDHRGRPLRFYSDLVKGRVVAINFIFTSCKTICPTQSIVFGQLQRMAGDRPVQLISVSLDPLNDRPEQLADWAQRYRRGPRLDPRHRREARHRHSAQGVIRLRPRQEQPCGADPGRRRPDGHLATPLGHHARRVDQGRDRRRGANGGCGPGPTRPPRLTRTRPRVDTSPTSRW